MGTIFSYIIYASYILMTVMAMFSYVTGRFSLFLFSYFSLLHFNVTSFVNAGIAWTGEYIVVFFVALYEILLLLISKKRNVGIHPHQKKWILLFFVFFVSVLMAALRLFILYDQFGLDPISRSLKSFFRYLLIVFAYIFIANRLSGRVNFDKFLVLLSASSLFPVAAVLWQSLLKSYPMFLLHNNKTFTPEAEITLYDGIRAVGLSNEASFFAYIILFPTIACLVGFLRTSKIISKVANLSLFIVIFLSVALTLSRTGMIGVAMVSVIVFYSFSKRMWLWLIILMLPTIVMINFLTQLSAVEFSLIDRFLSLGNVEGDLSNMERLGIFIALAQMLVSPGAIFGYGFFNYLYYIKDFIPSFVGTDIVYQEYIPTFNLLAQLVCEVGYIPTIVFAIYAVFTNSFPREVYILHRDRLIFHRTFILTILLFSLSFNIFSFAITFLPIIYVHLVDSENIDAARIPIPFRE